MSTSQPLSAKHLLKLGWGALSNKNNQEAIQFSQQLTKLYPDNGEGWYFTGQVAIAISNIKAAQQSFKNACKINPKQITWKISLIKIFFATQQFSSTRILLDEIHLGVLTANEHNQVALLYSQINQANLAVYHYQKAIELAPHNYEHYYSLAAVQRHLGELVQAEINLNRTIDLCPLDIDAHALRVDLKKQTLTDNHITSLNHLLTQDLKPKQKVQVFFALAKSYEDMQNYQASFKALKQGTDFRREYINYQISDDQNTMNEIQKSFDLNWYETQACTTENQSQLDGSKALTPIFILGMPRTGSTLTDRIMSAGLHVHSAGEINDFSRSLNLVVQSKYGAQIKSKQDFISASADIDYTSLGQHYLDSIEGQLIDLSNRNQLTHFTDKLPFNFLNVGLIIKALPQARIIHVTRNPMDTCYAIFKTLFQDAYPFSYNLKEVGQYFIQYKKLMTHWSSLNEMNIHEVSYEKLVSSPIEVGQALYEFCGLEWQDDFIEVKKQQGIVNTASASQVRQDIHQNSVLKWQQFSDQLGPLKAQLEQAGICCD